MLGQKAGFWAPVMQVAPHVISLHYMIHQFALSCKVFPAELFDLLSLIKMVNNVEGSALNNRLFKILCEDLSANHSVLLFHSNMSCLSRGYIGKYVYELCKQLLVFFQQCTQMWKLYHFCEGWFFYFNPCLSCWYFWCLDYAKQENPRKRTNSAWLHS